MTGSSQLPERAGAPAGAPAALLVRPARFGYNAQTAASNAFQRRPDVEDGVLGRARAEFDALCTALTAAGVRACVVEDCPEPPKPDAVFPNNWVSWHGDGTVVLYPMQAPNRRLERRADVLAAAEAHAGFHRRRLLDLSRLEREGRFLEGTGSLVLDHRQRVAYACRSRRTDEAAVMEWARQLGYEPLVFDAVGPEGRPIYHTNVLLAIGTHWAVVCTQAILPADRSRVLKRLRSGDRELIDFDLTALLGFAGNILELSAANGMPTQMRRILAMSERARAALAADGARWERLRDTVDAVLAVSVPTIESVGGGSVRCMLAEIPVVQP